MAQLVELNKNADKFKEMGVEVIAVFREEAKGVEGLEAIKKKTKVDFTLCLDTGKKKTARYSDGRREFTNYVIDPNGVVQEIIKGSLKTRANSEQLLSALKKIKAKSAADDNGVSRDTAKPPGSEGKAGSSKKGG